MSIRDIIAIIILFAALGCIWYLFIKSLKIVRIIDEEKLTDIEQIKKRFSRYRKKEKIQ